MEATAAKTDSFTYYMTERKCLDMKKLYTVLIALFTMILAARTAYADAVFPVFELAENFLPIILIAVFVILSAILIHRIRKKKEDAAASDDRKN